LTAARASAGGFPCGFGCRRYRTGDRCRGCETLALASAGTVTKLSFEQFPFRRGECQIGVIPTQLCLFRIDDVAVVVGNFPIANGIARADCIELGFKRLKSLIGLNGPPGTDERSARPHVLAHLLTILLLEPLVNELEDSPRLAEAA
jgi:hypothetical protein